MKKSTPHPEDGRLAREEVLEPEHGVGAGEVALHDAMASSEAAPTTKASACSGRQNQHSQISAGMVPSRIAFSYPSIGWPAAGERDIFYGHHDGREDPVEQRQRNQLSFRVRVVVFIGVCLQGRPARAASAACREGRIPCRCRGCGGWTMLIVGVGLPAIRAIGWAIQTQSRRSRT